MFVKISKDFSQIVLANMKENYMLKEVEKNSYDQISISNLRFKIIREILHCGESDFIFICCNEYDDDLDIKVSMRDDFSVHIERNIEPNSIYVLDCFME